MMKKIQTMSMAVTLTLMAACVPEPLTGTEDTDDMGTGGMDMVITPDTGGMTDTGGTAPDTGGMDMPAGPTNPFTVTDTAAVMAGEMLFAEQMCSSCHNAEGTGLSKVPLATTAAKEDAYMFVSIRDGIAPKFMPAYGPTKMPGPPLTDDQMWQLVTYLKATYAP